MRKAGILLPISSLPSPYGIGSFSNSARRVIDLMALAGQSYWQILPNGPTGYGDSPYQSFSAFAGNPYFIDLDRLIEEGYLKREEVEKLDFGQDDARRVDYLKLYKNRFAVLHRAFDRRGAFEEEAAYKAYRRQADFWVEDYGLFMAIKNSMRGRSWQEWPDDIRLRKPEALRYYRAKLSDEVRFYDFLQYEFYVQYADLKSYVNAKGIGIIGDIPIYCSPDSSDAWANPELFQFDSDRRPTGVAGCPPDAFSASGQLWGNPLYNWEYHNQTHYDWWKRRIARCLELYDVVRIDHFRGFDEYYAIPEGASNAVNGRWEKGPGMNLFEALKENPKVTSQSIIAEDLGFLTPSVMQLVKDSGFPGMKVLEFAFDSRDSGNYLPHNYTRNCVCYTGTHDNQTLAAWYSELTDDDRALANDYLGLTGNESVRERNMAFIRLALGSVADTCVIPIQDYLCLGADARMNHPSTLGGNWTWRLKEDEFDKTLAKQILRLTSVFGRTEGNHNS